MSLGHLPKHKGVCNSPNGPNPLFSNLLSILFQFSPPPPFLLLLLLLLHPLPPLRLLFSLILIWVKGKRGDHSWSIGRGEGIEGWRDRGMKRARAVVDKEMTLKLPMGENYLMRGCLLCLIVLRLSNLNIGELRRSRAWCDSSVRRVSYLWLMGWRVHWLARWLINGQMDWLIPLGIITINLH